MVGALRRRELVLRAGHERLASIQRGQLVLFVAACVVVFTVLSGNDNIGRNEGKIDINSHFGLHVRPEGDMLDGHQRPAPITPHSSAINIPGLKKRNGVHLCFAFEYDIVYQTSDLYLCLNRL